MSTPLEIASGSSVISTAEVLIGTLAAWHPRVDVYVDPVGDPLALGTLWRVYACDGATKTLLQEGTFTGDALSESQRVLSIVGGGTTIELRALTKGPDTIAAIKGAIVGWDPAFAAAPLAPQDAQTHTITGPAFTTFGTLPAWRPAIDVLVDATAAPNAVGASTWEAVANIAGFAPCVIAAELLQSVKQTVLQGVQAGCQTWTVRARTSDADAPGVTAAIVGYSTGGLPAGGTVSGDPNAIGYFDPTGANLIDNPLLVAAPIDQFARPQIRDTRTQAGTGAVWRQGAWETDGDPAPDVTGEGIVLYGPNALGNGPNPGNGGYNRQKPDRVGLAQIIPGVNGGNLFYYFRADPAGVFLRRDVDAAKSWNVERQTGKTTIGVSGGSISSGSGSPEGAVIGSPGDLYMNTLAGDAGTTLWVKQSGAATNTGWISSAQSSWSVPAWHIDPQFGSDANDGLTHGTAFRTWNGGLIRTWGTTSPMLNQDTTVTFWTDQPDASDPIVLTPTIGDATYPATFTLAGQLGTLQASGAFSAVIAKNRAGDQVWTVTDAGKPANFWAAYVGYLVHDTIADAWFVVRADLGGATAQVSEPLGTSTSGNPDPPAIPIAALDTYEIYPRTRVNLVNFSPIAGSGNAPIARYLWCFGSGTVTAIASSFFQECRIDPFFYSELSIPILVNCYMFGIQSSSAFIVGGVLTFLLSVLEGAYVNIDGDALIDAPAIGINGGLIVCAARFQNTLSVPNLSSNGGGRGSLAVTTGGFYGFSGLWGTAGVDTHVGGDLNYTAPAVNAFLNSGALTLDGAGVASNYTAGTGLWIGGVAISPAQLDAALPGGFAGVAYGVLGSKIRSIA